ncbi:uncharacterized protein SCODWIG_03031 [Saccharomycodes ludwigii]|uniref:SIT4-associating protein SAP190 n=2 Tax=Saccharomycodes ludwigii TaxID=36035 RepID=A0A376BAU6_9ASCO|nr:uncharacterized protein SCODWIG_03031 [Saccharomycodes ludwigii]
MEITAVFLEHDFLITKLWSLLEKYSVISNDASSSFLKINERLLQFAELGGLYGDNSLGNSAGETEQTPPQLSNQQQDPSETENSIDVITDSMNEDNPALYEQQQMYTPILDRPILDKFLRLIIKREKMVDKFIKHIELPPLMDFLLKIISTDKPESANYITLALKQEMLIEKLLDCLTSEHSSTAQSTASDFIKALVAISANSNNEIASAIGPNELTRYLVSPIIVAKIGQIMLQGGLPLSNCVGIIIEIIRKNNSDYDFVQVMYTTVESHPPHMRDPIYLGHLIKYFAENMDKFNDILCHKQENKLSTPFGEIEPLGLDRFKVCELVAELLHCSNMALLNEPRGEVVVYERDVIRQHNIDLFVHTSKLPILQVENKQQEIELDKGIANLTITGNPNIEEDNKSEPNKIDDNGAEDSKLIKSEENSSSDDKEESTSSKNSDEDSDGGHNQNNVGFNNTHEVQEEAQGQPHDSNEILDTEESLRIDPVVGDQLKISLQDYDIVSTIMKMLFTFPWNNFLHNVVFDIVQQILNGPLQEGYNKFLIADLFKKTHITQLIMQGDKDCEGYHLENNIRLGYMGHLTLIAEEVAKFAAYLQDMDIRLSDTSVESALTDKKWVEYTDVVLSEIREKYSTVFGDFNVDMYDVLGTNGEMNQEEDMNQQDYKEGSQEEEDDDDDEQGDYPEDDDEEENIVQRFTNRNTKFELVDQNDEDGDNDEDDNDDDDDDDDADNYGYTDERAAQENIYIDTELSDEEEDEGVDTNEEGDKLRSEKANKLHDDNRIVNNINFKPNFPVKKTLFDLLGEEDDDEEEEETEDDINSTDNKDGSNTQSLHNDLHADKKNYTNSTTSSTNINTYQIPLHRDSDSDSDDDYIDPNDDGLSYAKPNHPLYSNNFDIISRQQQQMGRDNDDDNNEYDDVDDDYDEDAVLREEIMGEEEDDDDEDTSLCRQDSSDNMQWDAVEQNRIMNMVNYNNSRSQKKKKI